MPSHHLSTSHTSAKMFNEMDLTQSTASALLTSSNHCSTCDARIARISMYTDVYPCYLI
jgi:hypothetical protein